MSRLKQLVLIAGLSGAGKSSALKHMEDRGFFWMDNLPVPIIPSVLSQFAEEDGWRRRIAVGLHIHGPECLPLFHAMLRELRDYAEQVQVIFLEARHDILIDRYRETRRRHPQAVNRTVQEAVLLEASYLEPIRALADVIIDTAGMSVNQLKDRLDLLFKGGGEGLTLFLRSFGVKYSTNTDADIILDARFLANPYYDPALRPLSGLDEPVQRFLEQDGEAVNFLDRLESLFSYLIPLYQREKKKYLTVDIGCTGGRHRSVYLVERLAERLSALGHAVQVRHRDLDRESPPGAAPRQ